MENGSATETANGVHTKARQLTGYSGKDMLKDPLANADSEVLAIIKKVSMGIFIC